MYASHHSLILSTLAQLRLRLFLGREMKDFIGDLIGAIALFVIIILLILAGVLQ